MEPIESVLIVGAGAVGVAVGSIIESNLPGSVKVFAEGERLERYRRDGFVANGVRWDFPLVAPGERCDCGLVIVAVKNHHLAEVIEQIKGCVSEDATIISLMNGITSEETLGAAFGAHRVPYGMILAIDAVRVGNETSFVHGGTIFFGDGRNTEGAYSPRVQAVADFFDRGGMKYQIPEDMLKTLWFKWMINVGINQASAILKVPYRTFQTVKEAKDLMFALMEEVIAVSGVVGSGLVPADYDRWLITLSGLGPEGKTSMLQDVEAKRKTEVEAFADALVEIGRRHGVPTPANEFAALTIKAMERSYGA